MLVDWLSPRGSRTEYQSLAPLRPARQVLDHGEERDEDEHDDRERKERQPHQSHGHLCAPRDEVVSP